MLAEASGISLGSVVNKYKLCGGKYYQLYKKLYDTCVTPVMDYCGAVWGFKDYDKCNTIQNRAIRAYLGVHRFSSNIAIHGDLAWMTPIISPTNWYDKIWYRILCMSDTRLPKQLYKWETRLNRNNWYTDLKKVFISIKIQDIIDTPDPDSICLKNVVYNALKELTLH